MSFHMLFNIVNSHIRRKCQNLDIVLKVWKFDAMKGISYFTSVM